MRLRLREVRLARFLTQAELADLAGTTEATVNRLENGLQRPRISTVRKLAHALGVAPEELVIAEGDEATRTLEDNTPPK